MKNNYLDIIKKLEIEVDDHNENIANINRKLKNIGDEIQECEEKKFFSDELIKTLVNQSKIKTQLDKQCESGKKQLHIICISLITVIGCLFLKYYMVGTLLKTLESILILITIGLMSWGLKTSVDLLIYKVQIKKHSVSKQELTIAKQELETIISLRNQLLLDSSRLRSQCKAEENEVIIKKNTIMNLRNLVLEALGEILLDESISQKFDDVVNNKRKEFRKYS